MLSTRMMPASRKTASQTASSPASEPVWLAAASAPCGVRPDLIARIGLALVAAGDAAGRLDQPPPVAQLLQVQQDHVGLRVVVQIVEQLDLGHARLVAETDELGEADLLFAGVVEHRRAQRARLAEEGDPPGGGHLAGERGVQPHRGIGVDHAQAVRPDHGDAVFGADFLQPLLRARRPSGPTSRKPAEMTIADLTPFLPHCSKARSTTLAGKTITAWSTASSMSST